MADNVSQKQGSTASQGGDHEANQAEKNVFQSYLIRPEMVEAVWEAQNVNQVVQKILKDFIEEYSEESGVDLKSWNEFENRFESSELKWISDFVIRNLIFVKKDLEMGDNESIAHVMNCLWQTLDLFSEQVTEVEQALPLRFQKLQRGLTQLFQRQIVNKEQVRKILDYCKRTIFGHLHLYIACLSMKKQVQREKKITIFAETPQLVSFKNLETDCKEVVATQEGKSLGNQSPKGSQLLNRSPRASETNLEEQEEEVDPNDPLYGLDERLAGLAIDEESKAIVRKKLMDAHAKIKEGLEKRQTDLEAKLQEKAQGKKR